MKVVAHVKSEKVFSTDYVDVKTALRDAKKLNPKVTHINTPSKIGGKKKDHEHK